MPAKNNLPVKIYLRPEQAAELEKIALAEDRSVTGLIRLAVDAWLQQRKALDGAAA